MLLANIVAKKKENKSYVVSKNQKSEFLVEDYVHQKYISSQTFVSNIRTKLPLIVKSP